MRIFLLLAALVLAPPIAYAADPVAPRVVEAPEECDSFGKWLLWGDPTDCPDDEDLPLCEDPEVIRAANRFVARAEPIYLVPEIEELALIRELPQAFENPSPLDRRYCTAAAKLTNGVETRAFYFLEEDSGFVGISWKIYVCLIGGDDWYIYDGECRVAKPVDFQ